MEKRTIIKNQIEQAARVEFLRLGYNKATMRGIAKSAGISPAALYDYFPGGKKELFDQLNLPLDMDANSFRFTRQLEIAQAAMHVFAEKGYGSTSMNDIAIAAGISKPTLYQYFKGKDSLFAFSVQSTPLHNTTRFISSTQKSSGIKETIYEIGYNFLHMYDDPFRRLLLKTIISESDHFPSIGYHLFTKGIYNTHNDFVKYILQKTGCDQDTLSQARMAFAVFLGSLQSYVISYRIVVGAPYTLDQGEYLNNAVHYLYQRLAELKLT